MAVITFSDRPDQIWAVARWAYSRLLNDVKRQCPTDSDMTDEILRAEALDGLHVDR